MSENRWIELDGVVNMRDLGGLPTRDGGRTAYRRLIRSDNLQDLSTSDVRMLLEDHEVKDIVDLRTETELHAEGKGPLWSVETLAHHHHSLMTRETESNPAVGRDALAVGPGQTRDAAFWSDHYVGYLTRRPDSVCAALDVISRSAGATVIHCAAGKDRTGTIVALALDAVGVEPEAIIADYALTGERLEQIVERLMSTQTYAPALRTQRIEEQLPRPETMDSILTMLRSEFGGGAQWLRAHGWGEGDLDRLRGKLLA